MTKCKGKDCILSMEGGSSEACVFHNEKVRLSNDPINRIRDYLRTARNVWTSNCEKLGNNNPNTLVIRGISLDNWWISSLKQSINKSILFEWCTFESIDLVQGSVFEQFIGFRQCKVPMENGDSAVVIRGTSFRGGFTFEGSGTYANIDNCTIFDHYSADNTTFFNNCIFCSRNTDNITNIRSSKGLYISESKIESKVRFSSSVVRLSFVECLDDSSTVMEPLSELSLESCVFDKDLTIRGEIRISEEGYLKDWIKPKVVLKMPWFKNDSKLILRNLRLDDFAFSYYSFHNVVLENVLFARLGNRIGFYCERQVKAESGLLSYNDLRDTYKNLKQYYDAHTDYKTANSFHAGELWAIWNINRLSRSWIKQVFMWETWYWLASDFGQSEKRPLAGIAILFALSTVIYFMSGVRVGEFDTIPFGDLGDRVAASFELAFRILGSWFRPEGRPALVPSSTLGWITAFIQFSGSLVLGIFFLLALRRRFKR